MFTSVKNLAVLLIVALLPAASLAAPSLDMDGLGKRLGGWDDKGKTAAKYKSGDSNYRTYQPSVSTTREGGLFVSTKLNHIRGWGADDYSILELTFDTKGKLLSAKSSVVIGDNKFDTGIITGATDDERAEIAASVYNKLADQFAKWGEKGGRKNFPAVIQHNINHVTASVRP